MPRYIEKQGVSERTKHKYLRKTNREADKQRMEKYDNKQNNSIDTK